MLTQTYLEDAQTSRTKWQCRITPNGEIAVWRAAGKAHSKESDKESAPLGWNGVRFLFDGLCLDGRSWREAVLLGLVILRHFDSVGKGVIEGDSDACRPTEIDRKPIARKGLKGITTHGARMVRNAAYLIERDGRGLRAVFATATVPNLPRKQMQVVHQRWNKVVEIYRLYLGRALRDKGLSGESVTVTEIQEKRYQKTGMPILHIHTVFVGMTREGKWVLTPKTHDDIWRRALNIAGGLDLEAVPVACQLKRVKKSAEAYIGKYMSKGSAIVKSMVDAGFQGWMPKQWWNMSRSMGERIDSETIRPNELSQWLYNIAEKEGSGVWKYHHDVEVEFMNGTSMVVAKHGRLSTEGLNYVKSIANNNISP